jgi:hypothetical protein
MPYDSMYNLMTMLRILQEPYQQTSDVHIVPTLERLLKILPLGHDGLPHLLIAIDEASTLLEIDRGQTYTALHRALSTISRYPVWTVFLSTNGQIEAAVKPAVKDAPLRVADGLKIRPPPFIGFETDVHERERLQDHHELLKPMNLYSTLPHMIAFGRPLWAILSGARYDRARFLVTTKLLGGTGHFDAEDIDHAFAVLGFRLSLEPAMNDTQSTTLARTAVHLHLRMLVSVGSQNGTFQTATPSEPIVADAASHLLNGNPEAWQQSLTTVTNRLLSKGRIVKGERGELFSRMLCVLARDSALQDAYRLDYITTTGNGQIASARPFSCFDFLKAMLGDNLEAALNFAAKTAGNPNNPPRIHKTDKTFSGPVGFESFLHRALVNFNHISTTSASLSTTNIKQLLIQLLRQHSALQLAPQQQWWDLLIPMYLGDPNENLDPTRVSALVIQVKNRRNPKGVLTGQEHHKLFRIREAHYVHLRLELGARGNVGVTSESRFRRLQGSVVFELTVKGADATAFPVLKEFGVESIVEQLLDPPEPRTDLEGQLCSRAGGYHHSYPAEIWTEEVSQQADGLGNDQDIEMLDS